jgi:NADH-quinone oxidoreductase subunit F
MLYINPEMARSTAAMKAALEQWQTSDLLELGSAALGKPLELVLLPGSGHYIGGEETASMEWVENRFPFPRGKPPYPAQAGVHGCPTLINNVETLAHVSHIAVHGGAWFRSQGKAPGTGTKLYSLSGDVLYPGVFELPMGTPLRELIYTTAAVCCPASRSAVFTGGPRHPLTPPTSMWRWISNPCARAAATSAPAR